MNDDAMCRCGHRKSDHLLVACLEHGCPCDQFYPAAKPRDGMISCNAVHMLSKEYWGEPCPICELIEAAKEALQYGDWCHLEVRDRLYRALAALGYTQDEDDQWVTVQK